MRMNRAPSGDEPHSGSERLLAPPYESVLPTLHNPNLLYGPAYNKLLSMTLKEREGGVCAVSSGNHAQAVALAARFVGVKAVILMPEDAPTAKLEATRAYGAEVITYDRYSIPQYEAGRKLREDTGLAFVSSHDDPAISAGAGSAALELIEDVGTIDMLFAPIGGGRR